MRGRFGSGRSFSPEKQALHGLDEAYKPREGQVANLRQLRTLPYSAHLLSRESLYRRSDDNYRETASGSS